MAKQVITLHMYESTLSGIEGSRLIINKDWRDNQDCMDHRVYLGSTDVEVDFPEVDTRQLQIDSLEQQIATERGQSEHRVNLLLERISKLKAIGHEVGV